MVTSTISGKETETGYRITAFQSNPGLFYEDIGTLTEIKATWRLAVNMDMTFLLNRANDVSKNLHLLVETCEKDTQPHDVPASILCSILKGPVKEMKNKIDEKLAVVFDLVRPRDAKTRRGLIDGLGTVIKAITGNMDSVDAENIYADINSIKSSQDKLKNIMEKQIQVVESSLEIFNNISKNVQNNEEQLKSYINKVRDTLTAKNDRNTARQNMDEALTAIAVAVETLLNDVKELVWVVTEVSSGKVSAAIITPQKLTQYLSDALPHLPPGSSFPVAIHRREMSTLLRLADTKAYSRGDVITLILEIPLIGQERYSISKVYPVPIRAVNSSYYFIDTKEDMVAVNRESQRYLQISESELNNCKRINNYYICKPSHPSVLLSDAAPCEVLTFAKVNTDNNLRCPKRAIALTHTLVITMRQPGRWLYIAPKNEPISISCDNEPTRHETLQNSGILALVGICTVTAQECIIKTIKRYTQMVNENYLPQYNLTLTNEEEKLSTEINDDETCKIKNVLRNPEELKILGVQLKNIKNDLDTVNNNNGQYHHYVGFYSLGMIAPVALICYAIYKCRKYKRNATPSEPASPAPVQPVSINVENIDATRAKELRAELSRACTGQGPARQKRPYWKWNA